MKFRCKTGEMRWQNASPKPLAMESRTRFESFCAPGFAKHLAPCLTPVSAKPVLFRTFKATARCAAAMVTGGAGVVRQAGTEVAPALPGGDPGSSFFAASSHAAKKLDIRRVKRRESDAGLCCRLRRQTLRAAFPGSGPRYSAPAQCVVPHASWEARGDRSRFLAFGPETGTRSGNRRDVSLSPVPAPQPRPAIAGPFQAAPRNYHKFVAIPAS